MPSAMIDGKAQLPIAISRQIAVLDAHLGTVGTAEIFRGRIHNAPGLIGELMVAGETDPAFFGLPIKFTMGQGPVVEADEIGQIRQRADELWQEYRSQATRNPTRAAELRERYLRVIDARLLENPVVIVKVYGRSDADRREDDALRRLNHRNIVRRYARVDDPEIGLCLFTEAVRGKTLKHIWRRRAEKKAGPLPLSVVAHVGYQLAQALSHAHLRGIVQGDLQPENIFVEEPTESQIRKGKAKGIVKISTFGASPSNALESLAFQSPEQIEGCVPTFPSDVYQLGTTLWVLATGRLPYDLTTPDEVMARITSSDPHPNRVHHFRGEVSPRLEAVIESAREKDPKKRWPLSKTLEELTQLYASRLFTLDDGPRASIAEELLARAQTNIALKDYYRAIETLEVARDFISGVPPDRAPEVRQRYESLASQVDSSRAPIEALKKIYRDHIAPVDRLMERLYDRYGRGLPILTEEEKGQMSESAEGVVVEKRSLVDYILQHTAAAIQALGQIDGDAVGDMHRKMVDRASSQEEACSDLVARLIKFGEDYIHKQR